jgi:plastocyanin
MFRRSALLAALCLLATTATVSAATTTITITTFAYPATTRIGLGDTVTWQNHMVGYHHTSTSNTPLSLWSIDMPANGTSGSHVFIAAGTYGFHCEIHPTQMHGNIVVPMKASPAAGTTSITFVIRWATLRAPSGFRYLVQRKAPGGSFVAFKSTLARSVSWKPSGAGTWRFRAQLERTANGATSGFSPTLKVSVSS